jgi:hypothetical protein
VSHPPQFVAVPSPSRLLGGYMTCMVRRVDVWRLFKEGGLIDKRAPTPLEHENARI